MSKRKRTTAEDDATSSMPTDFNVLADAFDKFVFSLNNLIQLTPVENFRTTGLTSDVEDRVVIAKVLKRMSIKGQLSWMGQYLKNEESGAPQSTESDSSVDLRAKEEQQQSHAGIFTPLQDLSATADTAYSKLQISPQLTTLESPRNTSQWPPALPVIHDQALLKQAFTHRSYATVCAPAQSTKSFLTSLHNERLEFLGDSFLNHSVTKMLYVNMPDAREGEMSLLRAELIGNTTAASFGRMYHFDKQLLLNDTAERDGVRKTPKVIADTFEAYLGALVLDSHDGNIRADQWLKDLMSLRITEYLTTKNNEPINFLAKQQVWTHFSKKYPQMKECEVGKVRPPVLLKYEWVDGGGGNAGGFIVAAQLWVDGQGIEALELGRGFGLNKKEAEHRAAMAVLKSLGI